MSEWTIVLGAGAAAILIRLLPEAWLRGREPPAMIRDALPWLPVAVAGTLLGVLHFGAAPGLRLEYLVAAGAAGFTLLWRRTFYVPIVVGVVVLAALRRLT